jgi:hypothetical protein
MLRSPTIAIQRPMEAERWQHQNRVQIAGAISFERDVFVTTEGFFPSGVGYRKLSGYRSVQYRTSWTSFSSFRGGAAQPVTHQLLLRGLWLVP